MPPQLASSESTMTSSNSRPFERWIVITRTRSDELALASSDSTASMKSVSRPGGSSAHDSASATTRATRSASTGESPCWRSTVRISLRTVASPTSAILPRHFAANSSASLDAHALSSSFARFVTVAIGPRETRKCEIRSPGESMSRSIATTPVTAGESRSVARPSSLAGIPNDLSSAIVSATIAFVRARIPMVRPGRSRRTFAAMAAAQRLGVTSSAGALSSGAGSLPLRSREAVAGSSDSSR